MWGGGEPLQVEEILPVKCSFLYELGKGQGYLIRGQTTLVQLIEHQTSQGIWIKSHCQPWEVRT